jgi:hypothetical protein
MHPDVETLRDGGLRPTHVAALLKVNRNTVTKWYAGANPHRMISVELERLADAVRCAVDAGKLPVAADKLAPGEAYLRTYAIASEYRATRREGSGTT